MLRKDVYSRRLYYYLWSVMMSLLIIVFTQCETSKSITRRRIKSVEKGLLKAVVFKGQKVEKMNLLDRLQYYKVPAVSIAVIDKYQLEWAKAYGLKDVKSPEPITIESLFQAASISQSVSALGALRFIQEGRLELDEDVNNKLSSWKVPKSKLIRRSKVTLRKLLSHSAGLAEIEFRGYTREEALPSLKQILNGKEPANSAALRLVVSPGSKVSYSEAGYAILQQLLEDLEDKPFSKIMKEAVFKPLQMNHSSFECPLPLGLRAKAVSGHLRHGEPIEGKWYCYPEAAAAGLWTTPSDLSIFVVEIMREAMGQSQKLVSSQMAREMLTAQLRNQGLGFTIEDEGDNLQFRQKGHNAGFECFLVAYPVRGQGAVIMSNSDNGSYLIDEILRAISAVYDWPHFQPIVKVLYRLEPSDYEQYVGRYQVNPDYILNIRDEDYYLVIQPTGQAPTKFFVESQTIFFSTDPYIQIQFLRDSEGKVTGLIMRQREIRMEAKKIE